MRILIVLVLLGAVRSSTHAQPASPSPRPNGIEMGPVLGISSSGFSHSSTGGGGGATGNRGTAPYLGIYARRPLSHSARAELQIAFEVKSDDGDNTSIPFLQFPVAVEFLPFAPRRRGSYVRPVFIAGGSAGVRLSANGRSGSWGTIRAGEISAIFGLGVEAHSSSTDWIQVAVRLHAGLSDLGASPGRTTSNLLVAYVKFHPASRR